MVEEYFKEVNNNKSPKSNSIITKILLSVIFVFISLIYIKSNDKNLENYKKYVFTETISFAKANKLLNKLVDKKIVSDNKETNMVFNDTSEMLREKYENGTKIKYNSNSIINAKESGIVVFIGEKDNLGNTIIIQGIDGYDIWYSNIKNSNLTIYDYIEKNTIIGESEEVIITISKDGKYIDYEEYIK